MVSYGGMLWVAIVAVETCVWGHSLIAKDFDGVPGLNIRGQFGIENCIVARQAQLPFLHCVIPE
jgi:hypothetical protein